MTVETEYRSFGLPRRKAAHVLPVSAATALLKSGEARPASLLPFGNGRSYGDSCLNSKGVLADMRALNRIIDFNPMDGTVTAQAGVLLSDLITHVGPHGYFLPVVPGTRFVTLGGAIANDVHGKNHHRRGAFGCHVEALTLLKSDGSTYECGPDVNRQLFRATVGGMGLTGMILSATIRLMKVGSVDVEERVTPFSSLDEYFDLAEAADTENEYAVAWIDQLAAGSRAGRGLLLTANHAEDGRPFVPASKARLSVPFRPPFSLLNGLSISLFNAAYHWAKSRSGDARRSSYGSYFFPLDGVRNWNRLYGPNGLLQHQSVVPEEVAQKVVPALLEATREAGHASFLTVLKRFGSIESPGVLSFPRPGYTLTLDFPNDGERTRTLLERLDRITVEAGGAVNPYKDARMGPDVFAASFPGWRKLEEMRDPAFMSDFWRRTAVRLLEDQEAHRHAAQ